MPVIENKKHDFTPHPEGSWMAVMADTYLHERPNPWKGQQRDKNDPSKGLDDRETITELIMVFLTEHMVDINGKMLPAYVRYTATPSVAENANLRKFVQAWFPQLKPSDFDRFDSDKLIGKGAYITVKHNEGKNGKVYDKVIAAMQPPKGATLPTIPSDFVRHDDKPKPPAPTEEPGEKVSGGDTFLAEMNAPLDAPDESSSPF